MNEKSEMKEVSKEEFEEFLKNYPNELHKDWFMDWYSWDDFSDGKEWPESTVAMYNGGIYGVHIYKIKEGD